MSGHFRPFLSAGTDGVDVVRQHRVDLFAEDMLVQRFRSMSLAELKWLFCGSPKQEGIIDRLIDVYPLAELAAAQKRSKSV